MKKQLKPTPKSLSQTFKESGICIENVEVKVGNYWLCALFMPATSTLEDTWISYERGVKKGDVPCRHHKNCNVRHNQKTQHIDRHNPIGQRRAADQPVKRD